MELHKFIVGETYSMKSKDGNIIAKLVKIYRYPATGAPPDYIFEHVSGNDELAIVSPLQGKQFPIPALILEKINTEKIDIIQKKG